jgi:hypothetical protein
MREYKIKLFKPNLLITKGYLVDITVVVVTRYTTVDL